jgi:hypothetical protein
MLARLASAPQAALTWEARALQAARDADPFWVPVRAARACPPQRCHSPPSHVRSNSHAHTRPLARAAATQARGAASCALPPSRLRVVHGIKPLNWAGPPPTLTQARPSPTHTHARRTACSDETLKKRIRLT